MLYDEYGLSLSGARESERGGAGRGIFSVRPEEFVFWDEMRSPPLSVL